MSISDYSHFGELLAFDTTYKKKMHTTCHWLYSQG
ncbi:hypothetical protein LINPERPRIM_LOCUS25211 [Linum perenne]